MLQIPIEEKFRRSGDDVQRETQDKQPYPSSAYSFQSAFLQPSYISPFERQYQLKTK